MILFLNPFFSVINSALNSVLTLDTDFCLRLGMSFLTGWIWSVSGSFLQWGSHNSLACPTTLGLTVPVTILWLASILGTHFLGVEFSTVQLVLSYILLMGVFYVLSLTGKKIRQHRILKSHLKNSAETLSSMHSSATLPLVTYFPDSWPLLGIAANLSLASLYLVVQFYFQALGQPMPHSLWYGEFKQVQSQDFVILLTFTLMLFFPLAVFIAQKMQQAIFGISFLSGINPRWHRWQGLPLYFVLISIGVATLFSGLFSFWGLLMPHLLRTHSYFRQGLKQEAIYGGVVAGVILMLLDALCYQFPIMGAELPVGLITSFLGPFFFFVILFKNKKDY